MKTFTTEQQAAIEKLRSYSSEAITLAEESKALADQLKEKLDRLEQTSGNIILIKGLSELERINTAADNFNPQIDSELIGKVVEMCDSVLENTEECADNIESAISDTQVCED